MSDRDSKPNILIIMTDQQRADTIGALGNPIIQTLLWIGWCSEELVSLQLTVHHLCVLLHDAVSY